MKRVVIFHQVNKPLGVIYSPLSVILHTVEEASAAWIAVKMLLLQPPGVICFSVITSLYPKCFSARMFLYPCKQKLYIDRQNTNKL